MSFGPKHQRKVNECYPVRAGEEGAVSGKIATLTYYINAKPEKLVKVSAYLEKKVKKDVQRERLGYNRVTLEIVEGIMNGCGDYFGSFAPTALSIIDTLSETPDAELLTRTVTTFQLFCRMTRSLMVSMREESFFELLTRVVARLTALSSSTCNLEQTESSREKIVEDEIRTIVAVVGMEDFKCQGGKNRLAALLTSIIGHLGEVDGKILSASEVPMEGQLGRLIAALQTLIKNLSSTSLPLFMEVFFALSAKRQGEDMSAVWFCFQLLIKHLPSGFLCIFLTELFRQLERVLEPLLSLYVDVLAELLLSNRGPLGYTAVDIASNLIRLLRRQRPPAPRDSRRSFLTATAPPTKAVFTICNCLVSILRNTNFASQKYDIVNHIIHRAFLPHETKRLTLTTGSSTVTGTLLEVPSAASKHQISDHHSLATVTLDNIEESQFRAVIWSVLFAMAEEALPPSILKLAFVEIPQRLFDSLLLMAVNYDTEFRLNSLVLLHRLILNGLSFTGHSSSSQKSLSCPLLPKGGVLLLAKFRANIFRSLLLENSQSPHICAVDGLLRAVLREADYHHFCLSTLLLASLQDTYRTRGAERQVLFLMMLWAYLCKLGSLTGNSTMQEEAREKLNLMKSHGIHVFEPEDALDDYPPPLCIRTAEDPCVELYMLSLDHLKELLLSPADLTDEQKKTVETVFEHVPYRAEKDLEAVKEAGRAEAGRRSLFPASPKKPLAGSESSSGTLLAHRRSLVSMIGGDGTQTTPLFTKQPGASTVSISSQLSRTSSLRRKIGGGGLGASIDSLSALSDDDNESILDGDFANLTLRTKERAREVRERSTSLLLQTKP